MQNLRKFLELCTAHLPEDVAKQINQGLFPKTPAYTNEYGWVFHVPESVQDCRDMGVTDAAFLQIMAFAIFMDADYVMFDGAVELVDWLPVYDW